MDYFDILRTEFEKETDRAAVILAGSIADELLRTLLAARLVPVTSSCDELFDGANAPLGTFSSRIEMAYRVGQISVKFARDLHLIRKIRNEFAHNIHGCSFEDARVRSRVTELSNSHGIIQRAPYHYPTQPTTRNQFLEAASWMIFHLNREIEETQAFTPCNEEWGYRFVWDKSDTKGNPIILSPSIVDNPRKPRKTIKSTPKGA
jgi:DNA-binding MltR family transcriptional regulator